MEKSIKRKKDAKVREARKRARKNFLPTFVIITILWGGIGLLVYSVDPEFRGALPIFFGMVFLALLFTLSTIFANSRRGIIFATASTIFLILRYFGIGNLLNLLLVLGITLTIEIYFSRN